MCVPAAPGLQEEAETGGPLGLVKFSERAWLKKIGWRMTEQGIHVFPWPLQAYLSALPCACTTHREKHVNVCVYTCMQVHVSTHVCWGQKSTLVAVPQFCFAF